MELLEELTQAWGVSGRERKVRDIIRREVMPYADEIITDALGDLIVLKKGKDSPQKKKIMFTAHMDEIGFQVTKIDDDGKIRLCQVGWTWAAAIYNDKVIFQNGTIGVVGCEGEIEKAKNDAAKLYVDVGCTKKEDTEKHVKIGDYCGFIGKYYELKNNKVTSKSLDDRAGCYIMIEALKENKGESPNDVYYVFTVQEEVGCRGAGVSAERIKPDIGCCVDVTTDHYYPVDPDGNNAVGEGIGVKFGDPSAVMDEYLVNEMIKCCENNDIKYQRDVMIGGGTEASTINLSHYGVRVCEIALIDRYLHSQSSVVSKDDIDGAIKLADAFSKLTFDFDTN